MKAEKELRSLRQALNELHKLLLSTLKKDRERISGKVITPAEWFQILLSSPEYSWIRPLNSLLSDVDALSELSRLSAHDVAILHHELERFFFKDDDEITSFNSHYRKLFANNHDVMFAHGQLKQNFSKLPIPTEQVPLNADEIRRGWHKIGASKRKLLN